MGVFAFAGGKIEAGSGSVRVFQDHGAYWNHALALVRLGHLAAEFAKQLTNLFHNRFVELHLQPQHPRNHLASQVIAGWSQPAGHQQDIGPGKRLRQHCRDGVSVRNTGLAFDSQPQRQELLAQVGDMGVHDLAEQKFGSRVDDFQLHGCTVSACRGESRNFQRA